MIYLLKQASLAKQMNEKWAEYLRKEGDINRIQKLSIESGLTKSCIIHGLMYKCLLCNDIGLTQKNIFRLWKLVYYFLHMLYSH